jgi:signal transduction histidine kinase
LTALLCFLFVEKKTKTIKLTSLMLATPITGSLKSDPGGEEGNEAMQLHEKLVHQQQLLEVIGNIHENFAAKEHARDAFDRLLADLLSLTASEYGYIGEVVENSAAAVQLHTLASKNKLPDNEWNLTASLQKVAHTGQPIISNAGNGSSWCFLGLPVVYQQEVLAVIGLLRKTNPYTTATINFLRPLLSVLAYQQLNTVSVRDYQHLKKIHAELTSEFDALMMTLDDIVFEINDQKVFTKIWCNQENLLFRPREEVIGKTISDVLGEHAIAFNRMADKILWTGEQQEYIYPDVRKGLEHWYELKMTLIKSDPASPKRILLLIRNISARERKHTGYQQAQAELKRSNQLLGICQQMGKMGGWEFNVVTGEMYWTREVYALREVPTDFPITFHAAASFYHPEDQPIFEAARDRLYHEHIPFDLELRHISAKGKNTWVRTVGRAVRNNNGHLTHFRGIIMDITDKKDTELALTTARDGAQKAAQARSEFLSVMSHEIRTPLNAIIGIAGILQENPVAEHAEVIHSLQFSANHLLGLINDILDFSKMEAGKIELEKIHFDPTVLVQGIVANYQPLANTRGIDLLSSIDKNLPANIAGDPVRLSQILNNLLSNAIKFTSEGSVTISIKQESSTDNTSCISFTVKDTGIGIVPEMQDKIFETFVQEDSATTRNHGGTGLGLAITRKLVNLHNSHITLESNKKEGATFRFDIHFEVPENEVNNHQRKKKHAPGFLNNVKLLVVEDNAINIRILGLQLKNSGAVLTTACNGRQALEKIQEQSFDGIILDLHMPEMNGYETIPHIQHLLPDAFIIVLTADVMPEVKDRLSKLQVKHLLPKPYAAEDLLQMLAPYSKG